MLASRRGGGAGLLHRFRQKVEGKAFPCHLKGIVSLKSLALL